MPSCTTTSKYLAPCRTCWTSFRGPLGPDDPRGCMVPSSMSTPSLSAALTALALLFTSTNGANWKRSDGWGGSDPCSFYGVTCRGGAVVAVRLPANNLQGIIPSSFASQLPLLEHLDLSSNRLQGTLPDDMRALPLLVQLKLSRNRLHGALPDFSGAHFLAEIDLSENQFNGVFKLSYLPQRIVQNRVVIVCSYFSVSGNGLQELQTGTFSSIIDFTNSSLMLLDLSNNFFSGDLPQQLFEIPSLRYLSLRNNLFSGSLPDLAEVNSLRRLDLSKNLFYGDLPSSFKNLWPPQGSLIAEDLGGSSGDGGLLLDISDTCIGGNVSVLDRSMNQSLLMEKAIRVRTMIDEMFQCDNNISIANATTNCGKLCSSSESCKVGLVCKDLYTRRELSRGGEGGQQSAVCGPSGICVCSLPVGELVRPSCPANGSAMDRVERVSLSAELLLNVSRRRFCESVAPFEPLPDSNWSWWSGKVDLSSSLISPDECERLRRALPRAVLLSCPSGPSPSCLALKADGEAAAVGASIVGMRLGGVAVSQVHDSEFYHLTLPVQRLCVGSSACPAVTVTWKTRQRSARRGRQFLFGRGALTWSAGDQQTVLLQVNLPLTSSSAGSVTYDVMLEESSGASCGQPCSGEADCEPGLACKRATDWKELALGLLWDERCSPLDICNCSKRTGNFTFPPSCDAVVEPSPSDLLLLPSKSSSTITVQGCWTSPHLPAAARDSCDVSRKSFCGDGVRHIDEQCDDGNTVSFDGCSSSCTIERYYVCQGGSLNHEDQCTYTYANAAVAFEWINSQGSLNSAISSSYSSVVYPYSYRGCVADPFPALDPFDFSTRFYVASPQFCASVAYKSGYTGFCIRDGGICYTERDFVTSILSFGGSSGCHQSQLGGGGGMSCYSISSPTCAYSLCNQDAYCVLSSLSSYYVLTCQCSSGYTGNGEFCKAPQQQTSCSGSGRLWADGTCFWLRPSQSTYNQALVSCVALASILSASQQAAVTQLLGGSKTAWIGMTLQTAGNLSYFTWSQNSLLQQTRTFPGSPFTNWGNLEPRMLFPGSCVVVDGAGVWHTKLCNASAYALCATSNSDVNECAAGTDDCDSKSLCVDILGSYDCICDSGLSGIGRTTEMEAADPSNPLVSFTSSVSGWDKKLPRLLYGSLRPDNWLDLPYAILADEEDVFLQLDLGDVYPLGVVQLWMYYPDSRAHMRKRVEISVKGEFAGEQMLLYRCEDFHSCGPESSQGLAVFAYGILARHVRIYSGRSSVDPTSRFLKLSVVTQQGIGCFPCPLGSFYRESRGLLACETCAGGNESNFMLSASVATGCGAIGSCEDGSTSLPARCYRVIHSQQALSWEEASGLCRGWGGLLLQSADAGSLHVVRTLLQGSTWVGLRGGVTAGDKIGGGDETWLSAPWSSCSMPPCPLPTEPACARMELGGVLQASSCSRREDRPVYDAACQKFLPKTMSLLVSYINTSLDLSLVSLPGALLLLCGGNCTCGEVACGCEGSEGVAGGVEAVIGRTVTLWVQTSYEERRDCYVLSNSSLLPPSLAVVSSSSILRAYLDLPLQATAVLPSHARPDNFTLKLDVQLEQAELLLLFNASCPACSGGDGAAACFSSLDPLLLSPAGGSQGMAAEVSTGFAGERIGLLLNVSSAEGGLVSVSMQDGSLFLATASRVLPEKSWGLLWLLGYVRYQEGLHFEPVNVLLGELGTC